MTLNYYNLPIQYGGLIDNDWYDKPHYEHEDEVDFEYEVDDAKFIEVLSDIAIDNIPEEIPDEKIQEYVKEHSNELFQKHEQEVLDYFEDKARMSAEKYYNDELDWGGFDESLQKVSTLKEGVSRTDSQYFDAIVFLDENPTAFAYICSAEINGKEMPVGKGVMSSDEYFDYIAKLGKTVKLGKVNTMYQSDKEEYRKALHDNFDTNRGNKMSLIQENIDDNYFDVAYYIVDTERKVSSPNLDEVKNKFKTLEDVVKFMYSLPVEKFIVAQIWGVPKNPPIRLVLIDHSQIDEIVDKLGLVSPIKNGEIKEGLEDSKTYNLFVNRHKTIDGEEPLCTPTDKPEIPAVGEWWWDEFRCDWYDTGRKMYYSEIEDNSKVSEDDIVADELTDKDKIITEIIEKYKTDTIRQGSLYILPDGTLLDLGDSGYGHSDLSAYLNDCGIEIDYEQGKASKFLRGLGWIRVNTKLKFIDLIGIKSISDKQEKKLVDVINFMKDDIQVTVDNEFKVYKGVDTDYIIDRIKKYYQFGKLYESKENLNEDVEDHLSSEKLKTPRGTFRVYDGTWEDFKNEPDSKDWGLWFTHINEDSSNEVDIEYNIMHNSEKQHAVAVKYRHKKKLALEYPDTVSESVEDDFDVRWRAEFGDDNVPSIMSAEDTLAELKRMEDFE